MVIRSCSVNQKVEERIIELLAIPGYKEKTGAEELTRWLSALVVLAEDLSLIPSICVWFTPI